jgi:hypothetical protein
MTRSSDPREWHIASDKEGFFIENEYGEEVSQGWCMGQEVFHRWHDAKTAQAVCNDLVCEQMDNYEPPEWWLTKTY